MKLGLLTAAFPDTPLTEVADWAAANGFAALEVACWPRRDGAARRYGGVSHIDVAALSDAQAKELVDDLAGRGIQISGLGYYPNPLHPDPTVRDEALAHLRVLIAGVGVERVGVVAEAADGDAAAGQVLDQLLGLGVGQAGDVDVGHPGIAAGGGLAGRPAGDLEGGEAVGGGPVGDLGQRGVGEGGGEQPELHDPSLLTGAQVPERADSATAWQTRATSWPSAKVG